MPVELQFEELMNECGRTDPREFRKILKRNRFEIKASYTEREATAISRTLVGRGINWFPYRSRQRAETGETPLVYGVSQSVVDKLEGWFRAIVRSQSPPDPGSPRFFGLACAGGFLEGGDREEFLIPFEQHSTVLIGDRGSGKSTILNLLGVLSGSVLEESRILVERLASNLPEQRQIQKIEFARRVRKALKDYGLDCLCAFYIRDGKHECYVALRDSGQVCHAMYTRSDSAWQLLPETEAQHGYPVQYLQQGEAVRISESQDVNYLNKLIDSMHPDLHSLRSELAKAYRALLQQYENFAVTPRAHDFGTLRQFIDDQIARFRRWRQHLRKGLELEPILQDLQALKRDYDRACNKPSFEGLHRLLETHSQDDLLYFLLAPEMGCFNFVLSIIQRVTRSCNPPRYSPSPQVVFLRLSSSWTETSVLYGRHRMWNSSAIELFQGSARDLR